MAQPTTANDEKTQQQLDQRHHTEVTLQAAPPEVTTKALSRLLYGITDEMRQAKRDAILSATSSEIRRAAARLRDSMEDAAIAVLGRADAVDEASQAFPGFNENRLSVPL